MYSILLVLGGIKAETATVVSATLRGWDGQLLAPNLRNIVSLRSHCLRCMPLPMSDRNPNILESPLLSSTGPVLVVFDFTANALLE